MLDRWSALRATEGWAVLQHHSIIRTNLTVYPPATETAYIPRLSVKLQRGSFFAIVPYSSSVHDPVRWYSGNIYTLPDVTAQVVSLPAAPAPQSPTIYSIFISADYEIRPFGDPGLSTAPKLNIELDINIEHAQNDKREVLWETNSDVACDFVNGWAVGAAFGIGLRSQSRSSWWKVTSVNLMHGADVSNSFKGATHPHGRVIN